MAISAPAALAGMDIRAGGRRTLWDSLQSSVCACKILELAYIPNGSNRGRRDNRSRLAFRPRLQPPATGGRTEKPDFYQRCSCYNYRHSLDSNIHFETIRVNQSSTAAAYTRWSLFFMPIYKLPESLRNLLLTVHTLHIVNKCDRKH